MKIYLLEAIIMPYESSNDAIIIMLPLNKVERGYTESDCPYLRPFIREHNTVIALPVAILW